METEKLIESVWRWHHLGAGREALKDRTDEDLMRDEIIKRLEEIDEFKGIIEFAKLALALEFTCESKY